MPYNVFHRKWWKDNPSYPNGLEPDGTDRKKHIAYASNENEAREICRDWNNNHEPGRYSDKAEYESI